MKKNSFFSSSSILFFSVGPKFFNLRRRRTQGHSGPQERGEKLLLLILFLLSFWFSQLSLEKSDWLRAAEDIFSVSRMRAWRKFFEFRVGWWCRREGSSSVGYFWSVFVKNFKCRRAARRRDFSRREQSSNRKRVYFYAALFLRFAYLFAFPVVLVGVFFLPKNQNESLLFFSRL